MHPARPQLMIVDDRRVICGSASAFSCAVLSEVTTSKLTYSAPRADLNDRSQKGDGDSEIALVVRAPSRLRFFRRACPNESSLSPSQIEDTDMVESQMDGKPYVAAKFAKQWRHQVRGASQLLSPDSPSK